MYPLRQPSIFIEICISSLLFILLAVSCAPMAATPNATPLFQTVEITREVTREVTRQVTRIVEIPVTETPTITPAYTFTPSLTPTITPTPEPPVVTVLVHANCRYGPGSAYLYKYDLTEGWRMEVVGRNLDGTWLYIQGIHGWNPCWVKASLVRLDTGNLDDVRITYSILPFSTLYRPPTGVWAVRNGNTVTIEWNAVWMTEDDYRGYLIEAYVCQGRQTMFVPIGSVPPLDQNTGTLYASVTDEPGCLEPSNARIYTVEKHGYTGYIMIPWPAFQPTETQTPSPTATLAQATP
jgi:hypothetical protein